MQARQKVITLTPGADFGPYYLERSIAAGGMAEVFLARTATISGMKKRLALKVMHSDFASDPRFVRMLADEARLAVTLDHPNIVQTFDLGVIEGRYFITMEYVDGADYFRLLTQLTERERIMPVEAALFVVRETMAGLHYAHTKVDGDGNQLRIIHRDVSPQNILLSRDGQVKIADFGIAKVANVSNQTRAGVIKGKLVYMSPEQSWGGRVDRRSDVFSAGIVLYEALTGGSLYREQNPVKLLKQVRRAAIPPPSSAEPRVNAELDSLVMRALAPQPTDRYATAAEFGDAIDVQLQQLATGYSTTDLAQLVRSVVHEEASSSDAGGRTRATHLVPMQRADFAAPKQSIIFSADEMMAPQMPADSMPPSDVEVSSDQPASASLILQTQDGPETISVGLEPFSIGRGGQLRLSDGRVSRLHARIVYNDGVYSIEDLKSSNGTYLNKARVTEPTALSTGDTIQIGPYEMQFVVDGEGDTARVSRNEVLGESKPSVDEAEKNWPEQVIYADPSQAEGIGGDSSGRSAEQVVARDTPADEVRAGWISVTLEGELLRLPVGETMNLGHSLTVGQMHVEGASASIVRRKDGYWFEPGNRTVEVSINGRTVADPVRLAAGDELEVGPLTLRFELG